MKTKATIVATASLLGVIFAAVGMLSLAHGQPPEPGAQARAGDDQERAADREAIRQTSREFADAFAKGDAGGGPPARGEYQTSRRGAARAAGQRVCCAFRNGPAAR